MAATASALAIKPAETNKQMNKNNKHVLRGKKVEKKQKKEIEERI